MLDLKRASPAPPGDSASTVTGEAPGLRQAGKPWARSTAQEGPARVMLTSGGDKRPSAQRAFPQLASLGAREGNGKKGKFQGLPLQQLGPGP